MTKDQARRLLDPQMQEVIRAFVDGKTIQCRSPFSNKEWVDSPGALSGPGASILINHLDYEWRVKPEPRQPRRVWVNEYAGELGTTACKSKEEADKNQNLFDKRIACVEFVEVIKEGQ